MRKRFEGLKLEIAYYPLDDSSNEIRLLELLPGGNSPLTDASQRVRCRLAHVSQDHDPEYTALSYVWGDKVDTAPVEIEYLPSGFAEDASKKPTGFKKLYRRIVPKPPKERKDEPIISTVQVTTNLEAALRHIRKDSESVLLWVDAICIDQNNNQEKNVQVGRMGSIFEKAAETIVWLGPAADDSDLLLDIFEEILPDALNVTNQHRPIASEVSRALQTLETSDDPIESSEHDVHTYEWLVERLVGRIPGKRAIPAQAAAKLFQREWWSRVWVVQEFILSKNTSITCGTKRFSFDKFKVLLNICFGMVKGYLKRSVSFRNLTRWELSFADTHLLMPLFAWSEMFYYKTHEQRVARSTLFENLYRTTMEISMRATDPRDYVFALLGIAKDDLGIKPEYDLPVGDVYAGTTMAMLQHGELFPLTVSHGLADGPDTPASWVVDWPKIPTPRMYHPQAYNRCSAAAETEAKLEPIPQTNEASWTLCISGVQVGRIAHLGERVPRQSDCTAVELPSVLGKYLNHHQFSTSNDEKVMDQQRMLDVADAYVVDRNKFSLYRRSGAEPKEAVQSLLEATRAGSLEMTDYAEMFAQDFSELLGGRRFFRTAEGMDGIAILPAQLNDLIVIFYGGSVPFVLRQKDDGSYGLVGAAYVDGIMHGEFMKEDLPVEVFKIR